MNNKYVVSNSRLYIDNKIVTVRGYSEEFKILEDEKYVNLIPVDMSDFATLYIVGISNGDILNEEKYFDLLEIAIEKGKEYNY
jgi:hypothetical protein